MAVENRFMFNYFELFNIAPAFELDLKMLEEKYLQLQKQHHPDNFTEVEEQLAAVEKITAVNEAYETLKNQAKLLEYYLRLEGYELTDKQIQQYLSQDDLLALLDAQENDDSSFVTKKLESCIVELIRAIKSDEVSAIKCHLAEVIFFNRSLKHV